MNGTESWPLGQSADHCLPSAYTCLLASFSYSIKLFLQGTKVQCVFFLISCIHEMCFRNVLWNKYIVSHYMPKSKPRNEFFMWFEDEALIFLLLALLIVTFQLCKSQAELNLLSFLLLVWTPKEARIIWSNNVFFSPLCIHLSLQTLCVSDRQVWSVPKDIEVL